MSEFQKVLNLIRGGGGRKFSKSSEIQKVLNYPRGGGDFSQIFPFFFVTPPLSKSAQLELRLRLSLAISEFDFNIAKLGIYRIYQKNSFHGYFYMKVLPCDNMTVI